MDFPVCFNLSGRRVLVVGGGAVASRKAVACWDAGGRVTAVAPEWGPSFECLRIEKITRRFEPGDLKGAFIVFAATDDREANRSVAAACLAQRILCNVADDPGACDFTLPAVARRGSLTLAVSTGGASPALAGRVRDDLAACLPQGLEGLTSLLRRVRTWMVRSDTGPARRAENGARLRAFVSARPDRLIARGDLKELDVLLAAHFGEDLGLASLDASERGGGA
jgi:precorrin-2 dehydrogenase/sirohydrochlorin ferrochelatase